MTNIPRRDFLKTSALLGGAAALAAPAIARAAASPNDRFRVAVVGLGGRGRVSHCGALLEMAKENVEIAALCDCDESRMQLAANRSVKRSRASGRRPWPIIGSLLEDKIDRRRGPGHSQPLARPANDLGLPGRQGRLRREAGFAQHLRRPQDDRGGPQVPAHRAARHAMPHQPQDPRRNRKAQGGGDRPRLHGAGHRLQGPRRRPPQGRSRFRRG